jgi:hypothetical protein
VSERGAGLKRGEGMRGWPENARTWASPRRGRGREVRDGLTGGVRGTERESERVRKSNDADRSAPQSSEREIGREEVRGWRRQAWPACQGPGAQRRAREAGPGGLTGPNSLFYFSREFLIAFLFIFSRVFNSNSNQVSNLNQIKHVQQIKEYLELNMMQHFMTHIVLKKIK